MSTLGLKRAGEWIRANQGDIAVVLGFILVSIISFGAGRLTAPETVKNPVIIEDFAVSSTPSAVSENSESAVRTNQAFRSEKGLFVSSKSGKKFHWPWCSYAKNIKESNQVWFDSESQAKVAGYSPCGCISSSAPAGYIAE